MKTRIVSVTATLLLIGTALGWVFAERALANQRSPYVTRGSKLFKQYCVACHGSTGKGDGPAAAAFKVAPVDLTVIQKPGEKFPFSHVQTKIDGEKATTAHGTSKMPVWGTIFRRTQGDLQKQGDIYSLVKYIESIQVAGK